jgi:hypothetical protein
MSRRSEDSALSFGATAEMSFAGAAGGTSGGTGTFRQREVLIPLITAQSPAEFRTLLGEIRKAVGYISFGQIAAKTNMARSTAFGLTDTKRPGMPTRELVILFVTACGLSQQQVREITELWHFLATTPERAVEAPSAEEDVSVPAEVSTDSVEVITWNSRQIPTVNALEGVVARTLRSDAATRRAVRLLWPLALVVSVLIGAVTVIALFVPGAAPALGAFFLVASFGALFFVLMVARMRLDKRVSQGRSPAAGTSRPPDA